MSSEPLSPFSLTVARPREVGGSLIRQVIKGFRGERRGVWGGGQGATQADKRTADAASCDASLPRAALGRST